MEVEGKIIQFIGETTGVAKSSGNPWKKREYVLETMGDGNFPRRIAFDLFGERADQYPLNVGDVIKLSFDIESREYQGKWYTNIRGWKCEPATASASQPAAAVAPQTYGSVPPPPMVGMPPVEPQGNNEDLPF